MSKYDHWVQTQRMEEIAGRKWAAKAFIHEIGTDNQVVLHEHWGMSKEEAAGKAEQEARQWIAAQENE